MTRRNTEPLEKALGHSFRDKDLLARALTHSSAAHTGNYERLEFLGDRVLGLVIAEILYEKFPGEPEGDLAKRLAALVQGEMLAEIARGFDLGAFIDFSAAERGAGGAENENILSDVFEALIGALYLEAGLPPCRALIENLWERRFYDMKTPPMHAKTLLQEWAQGRGLPLPAYRIAAQHGPDHAPMFEVALSVKGYDEVKAQGRSRQQAERDAAQIFMNALKDKT